MLLDDDLDALCLVPGVGKKTAARLLVELKSRLDVPELDGPLPASVRAGGGAAAGGARARDDLRQALASLGYQPDEVHAALRDLPDEGDPSVLLKLALQRLAVA